MKMPVLDRLLRPERVGRKATLGGDFAVSVITERPAEHETGPWVVSNMRGSFVATKRSKTDMVRSAFTECPVEDEEVLLAQFFSDMCAISQSSGWANVCPTIEEATQKLSSLGYEPRTLIVPFSSLKEVCGKDLTEDEAAKLILVNGCISEVDGIRILPTHGLPDDAAILGTIPALTGVYVRTDDRVSILVERADRSIVLINNELARETG